MAHTIFTTQSTGPILKFYSEIITPWSLSSEEELLPYQAYAPTRAN